MTVPAQTVSSATSEFGLAWPHPLFPYQVTGVRALISKPSLLLADEMGLGKTIQVIAALRCMFAAKAAEMALVVAPAGLVLQWRREFRLWAPELQLLTVLGSAAARAAIWRARAQVYITSYETLRADIDDERLGNRDWDVVAIDEAQRIKNPDADISRAVKRLPRRYGWALSGTPLENSLDDLISILDFVAPGRFRPGTFARGLRRLLGEVQLRRRRAEVLQDLPPKLPVQVVIDLEPPQRLAYERAKREGIIRLASLGADLRINHVLELILRLKQICNFCPETGASAKLIDLRERLKRVITSGERALVFSQFAAELFGVKRLARELEEFHPLVLSGDLPVETRAEVIRQFEREHEHKVLLLSLRVGGTGLNLTAASFVFHFDRWWNPALESQAEDRTYRIGQTNPVHVYSYLCSDTVEERVAEILTQKRQLFTDVVDGVSLRHIRRFDLTDLLSVVGWQDSRGSSELP
jgi:SNF2 family DNA or RNA helicase